MPVSLGLISYNQGIHWSTSLGLISYRCPGLLRTPGLFPTYRRYDWGPQRITLWIKAMYTPWRKMIKFIFGTLRKHLQSFQFSAEAPGPFVKH